MHPYKMRPISTPLAGETYLRIPIWDETYLCNPIRWTYTVKNGKFKKILTSEIKTVKLFICNSKICFRSFTPFDFHVANWDFCGLYRCCFAKEDWSLQKTQYFFGSSLFVAQHYSSAYAVTSMTHPSPSAGGRGVAGIWDKIWKMFRFWTAEFHRDPLYSHRCNNFIYKSVKKKRKKSDHLCLSMLSLS